MQDYINEILHRINEEMELLGIDENVCVEDALHMIDVIRPLFDNLRSMTVTVSPVFTPIPIRAMSLVAAADLLPSALVMVMVLSSPLAALARSPAGRAWMPTGSEMV